MCEDSLMVEYMVWIHGIGVRFSALAINLKVASHIRNSVAEYLVSTQAMGVRFPPYVVFHNTHVV